MKSVILISVLVSFLNAQVCFATPYGGAQAGESEFDSSIVYDVTFNGVQKTMPGIPIGIIPIFPGGGGHGHGPIGGGTHGGVSAVYPGGIGVALFSEFPQDFRNFPTELKPVHRPLTDMECKIQAIAKQHACGKEENRQACQLAIWSISNPGVEIESTSDDMNNRVSTILAKVKDENAARNQM